MAPVCMVVCQGQSSRGAQAHAAPHTAFKKKKKTSVALRIDRRVCSLKNQPFVMSQTVLVSGCLVSVALQTSWRSNKTSV